MSQNKKIWFAILAFAPLLMLSPFYYSLINIVPDPEIINKSSEPVSVLVENIFVMTFYIGLWALLLLISLIYYINDVLKNPKFKGDKKTHKWFWFFLIFLMTSIAMIVYFFKEIKNRESINRTRK